MLSSLQNKKTTTTTTVGTDLVERTDTRMIHGSTRKALKPGTQLQEDKVTRYKKPIAIYNIIIVN